MVDAPKTVLFEEPAPNLTEERAAEINDLLSNDPEIIALCTEAVSAAQSSEPMSYEEAMKWLYSL